MFTTFCSIIIFKDTEEKSEISNVFTFILQKGHLFLWQRCSPQSNWVSFSVETKARQKKKGNKQTVNTIKLDNTFAWKPKV